ncbi:endonuclease/exonuclease/phosphatase family protein [Streptomyces sp. NPDC059850]|uniref:endonuclease/exonuclease/phosphatase family protein n=1 Tax=Streptomyces sp. NPDC059850 TaxID=3346970 RepID=UPI0036574A6B
MHAIIGRKQPAARIATILAALVMSLCGTLLAWPEKAHAASPPDDLSPATWNMQYSRDNWNRAWDLGGAHHVVALQELPQALPAEVRGQQPHVQGNVERYTWQRGDRERYLYVLRQPSRTLGMVTSFRSDVHFEITSHYRSMLAVVDTDHHMMFASAHASAGRRDPYAPGGADAPALLRRAEDTARIAGVDWMVLGDFNREPRRLLPDIPNGSRIYNSGRATHRNGGELDYAVSNVTTDRWQAGVGPNAASDHWPVEFGTLRAAGERGVAVHNVGNGEDLGIWGPGSRDGAPASTEPVSPNRDEDWVFLPSGVSQDGKEKTYRIVSMTSPADKPKCLDVEHGPLGRPGDRYVLQDCRPLQHPPGLPDLGASQNFSLTSPDPRLPNMHVLTNEATGFDASVLDRAPGLGHWIGLGDRQPKDARTYYFYLNPVTAGPA